MSSTPFIALVVKQVQGPAFSIEKFKNSSI